MCRSEMIQQYRCFCPPAYPDRKGAENILKQERKSEKPYDVCFYADAGLREISAKRRKPAGTGDDCVS